MKGFTRNETRFSLCGLNCGLCSMHLGGYCPGCGGGAGNQSCAIARCSLDHGSVPFCWECPEYPCAHYEGFDDADSFVPHRNRKQDIAQVQALGLEAYLTRLEKKLVVRKSFWLITTMAAAKLFSTQRSISCPWRICGLWRTL